jgi:UDP-2,3-diacylglucosamine pyrophosphatase LpxH
MPVLEQPLVVVGDVHLSHAGRPETGKALARLVEAQSGSEIILNGDIFNLSLDAPERDPIESVLAMLHAEPALKQAFRNHLAGRGRLTFLPGNHDAALSDPALRAPVLAWLELGDAARVTFPPWFVRRGRIHVEHGHVYDPDNAPTHPLIRPTPATEPLGVALTRRFLAPNRAFDFAHATEITPGEALARAVRVFGTKMPLILVRYFQTSSHFCREAGWRPELARERSLGEELLPAFAKDYGLELDVLRALLEDRPRPTHESFERSFFRMYYDRIAATVTAGAGISLAVLAKSRSALGLAALSGLYLVESQRRGRNRYEGLPVRRLRQASTSVRDITGAETVIFGHTHVAETVPGYLNPGSFTYRAGAPRPYAWVGTNGQVERRTLE